MHFNFTGYDTSPYWHENGKIYVTGSHPWNLQPGINMVTVDLDTGKVDNDLINIWNGTGGLAPEGPHHYKKDGWYYLMIAEGGTGLNHMETIARAKKIEGPYDPYPRNPILTNANTSQYFQTVGHADLFQDASSNWWGVALSTRSGPRYITYPMGRETVLYPVTWKTGDWPVDSAVRGEMSSWPLPPVDRNLGGSGPFIKDPDNIDFKPGSKLPAHFVHWRWPIDSNYAISPPGHANALRLTSSKLNLTALDGNYAGPDGQTFVGRRQVDTLFTYSVVMDFTPEVENMEAGVTVFLTQVRRPTVGSFVSKQHADLVLEPSH